MRKILLSTIALVILFGATSASAQLSGTWTGTGEGICPPPWPTTTPVMMNPWQEWEGEIPATGGSFAGEWSDGVGFHGKFNGTITLSTPIYAICNGEWTAINDNVDPPLEYVMGNFIMRFYYAGDTCEGDWYSRSSVYSGTMSGEKVE